MGKREFVHSILPALLRPVARLCLRHSISIRDLLAAAKRAFLIAAQEELHARNEKLSISSICLLTGMHRVEIPKLLAEGADAALEKPNLLSKIVSTWENARAYTNAGGKPRVLSIDGPESDFHKLSWSVTKSLHPVSVLKELERLQLVTVTRHGARLLKSSVVPVPDLERAYAIMANDFTDLYQAIEKNAADETGPYDLHIRTEYDNIYRAKIPEIQRWLQEEGRKFHARARKFLSARDSDLNPEAESAAGCKVVLTSFSHSVTPSGEVTGKE